MNSNGRFIGCWLIVYPLVPRQGESTNGTYVPVEQNVAGLENVDSIYVSVYRGIYCIMIM